MIEFHEKKIKWKEKEKQ